MTNRRIPRSVIALGLVAAIGPMTVGNALAAPTGAAASPGGATGAASTPVYISPGPAAQAAPAPVTNYAPQIQQAAQPLQYAPQTVYVQGEPTVITQTVTQTEYVDRNTVQESGGLLLMNPEVQRQIGPMQVVDAGVLNYNERSQYEKDQLALAAASGAGGAILGAVGGGVLGAAGGAAAGAATGFGVSVPVTILFTGAAIPAGMAIGATLGLGAGAVAGATAGAAGGADAAFQLSGTKDNVQSYAADIIWEMENDARINNGYLGLVGDKPSGLDGYRNPEDTTDTRITDGTVAGEGIHGGTLGNQDVAGDAAPAPAEQPAPAQVTQQWDMPSPYQEVMDLTENTQQAVNDFGTNVGNAANQAVDNAQQGFADLVNTYV